MADTKQTKTIGEHLVASELARRGWAPALTRDGLERTDILAVDTGPSRRMVEIQVKSARTTTWSKRTGR
jgi:predicted AAA+ superfamily ATPase